VPSIGPVTGIGDSGQIAEKLLLQLKTTKYELIDY
jgi:hypothetical protein